MCGFTGFTLKKETDYDKKDITEKMLERIRHRGPDSSGTFISERLCIGFCRLSIIDIAGGDQPMYSDDGRYVIAYNGEVYNYKELRAELEEKFGMTFSTDSDTEVVLKSYIAWRKEAVKKFRGMFAFVVYDIEKDILFGARDPFGIKPFYYAKMNGELLFSSEIKSFTVHPDFVKEINLDALKMYLVFQYSPLEETIFKNVYKLLPGSTFTWEDGNLRTEKYFDPMISPGTLKADEAAEKIDEVFSSSVAYHQISDVEVGSFLSGGVDSGYLASLAKPRKTYSVGFNMEGFDEIKFAEDYCITYGTLNKSKEISADEFFAALPKVQYHSDEPHANLSAVPLYYLSELCGRDLKVVLSGEGADEFFAGYDWYIEGRMSARYKKLPLSVRKTLAGVFLHAPKRIKRFFTENAKSVEDTYIGQAFIMDDDEANSLLNEKYRSDITYKDVTAPYFEKVKDCDALTKKLYLDMNLWLPGDILLKGDKMTMAHSLEMRVPYLDKEMWNIASSLSSMAKQNGRHTKIALRKAAAKHIPQTIAGRKKAGFMVPFREWIKEDKYYHVVREALTGDTCATFFDQKKLLSMLEDYKAGRANNARKIYTAYAFIVWYDVYFKETAIAQEVQR